MAERFFLLWRAFAQRVADLRATPAARERALASAVFAGIFMFAALSMDYLITRGPDWNPGGTELSVQAVERVAATSLHMATAETPPTGREPDAVEPAELDGPIAELLGGPDQDWASTDYEGENAPSAEFYEVQSAGKQIEIAFPAEPAVTAGKNKPLATLS